MANHLFDLIRLYTPDSANRFIETEDGQVFTYGDLFDATGRFANALVACGVKPGDRVNLVHEGQVLAVAGVGDRQEVTVHFPSAGTKKLLVKFANLSPA